MIKTFQNILILVFILISTISCGQNKKSENLPKTKIDVQKEVDENGNIIRYDSTYSYSHSSTDSSISNLNVDSIFQEFNSRYDFDHSPFFQSQDSLFKHFFDSNFFQPYKIDSSFFEKEFKRIFDQHRHFFDNDLPVPKNKSGKKETEI